MNVLIIEDEARAANHLERLIKLVAPEMNIVKKFETVRDAVKYLSVNSPSLIFSDVQLADGISFEIFEQVKVSCPIIFTTAFDQYAIEAFKTNGVDYLLKPIEEERLRQAIQKVKQLSVTPNIEQLIKQALSKQPEKTKSRFLVKAGDRMKSISIEDIKAFYSFDKATYILNATNRSYAIDYSLDDLEELIDANLFFKVNRKAIVSIEACQNILAWSNSRLKLTIDGMDEPVIVAREKVKEFKNWLDR
ncbi:MAG: LytTR family DNA-binding domain-containing protein [Salinivirgaceae bacterium]|jgi:DNA-binding LytR/AlgR family response regulator|nr:LytTR family DNA-binding domain-containing protein [Salinivirgaceae bacterium]